MPSDDRDATADAAILASRDAAVAARSAGVTTVVAHDAARVATEVVSRAREATAAVVAAAAWSAAETADRAAAAVEAEAVARAIDVAALAVRALETIAAALPADVDREAAQRAAALVADAVAADVVERSKSTAAAATTVAAAVAVASEAAASAAADAASAVEAAAASAAVATLDLEGSTSTSAQDSGAVMESTARVADLAARMRVVAALRDSEARFRSTFERAPVGMLLVSLSDADGGRILRVNQALCQLTGRSEAELLARHDRELFHRDDRDVQAELFAALLNGGEDSAEASARWTHADGHDLWVRLSMLAVHEGVGSPGYAVCQVQDMTGRRRAETALQVREARFRRAFDHGLTGVLFLELDGEVREANEAVFRFLHSDEASLVGRRLDSVAREEHRAGLVTALDELTSGRSDSYQAEHRFERPDGSQVWGLVRGALVQDEDGTPDYLVFQLEDITAHKDAEVRLAHQAMHDHLTGLPNRLLLRDHLQLAALRARRAGTHLAVLFIDVDDFKEVNDTLGHVVGDLVLVEIASRLTACLRDIDTAALGGDEFVVLCEDLTDPAEASRIIERVLTALAPPMTVAGRQIRVTVSIGVTTDAGAATPEEVLADADTAMYVAKVNGKNRHEVYESAMRVGAVRQATLLAELEVAIHDDQLRLHYQPMYDIRTGALVSVEALVRWQHPTLGLLPPGEFLDVAEGRPLMTPLGDWVLRTAAAQAALWQSDLGSSAPDMWVNISCDQLGRQHFVGVVEEVLSKTGLEPEKLGIEVTERQLIGRADAVTSELIALQGLGLRLAVDDFGTGFASMDYLRRFRFDEIKIDRSFISGLGNDRTDTAITSSIIELGRALDLVVVAEGVETEGQYDQLRALGCGVSQGYLHHRPAPAETIDRLLSEPTSVGARPPGVRELPGTSGASCRATGHPVR